MKPGREIMEFSGVLIDDQILPEGAHMSLLILRRNAHLFADIISSSSTSTTKEDIVKSMYDRNTLSLSFHPCRARNKGANGGAAIFVSIFCSKTGRRFKEGFTCVGRLGLDGKLYEVSFSYHQQNV